MIWSDEFNHYGKLNPHRWNMEVVKARAKIEPKYDTNDFKNALVADCMLAITVWKEENEGRKDKLQQ